MLVDGSREPGSHSAPWDGRDAHGRRATTGVYLYRLEAGDNVAVGKMALLR